MVNSPSDAQVMSGPMGFYLAVADPGSATHRFTAGSPSMTTTRSIWLWRKQPPPRWLWEIVASVHHSSAITLLTAPWPAGLVWRDLAYWQRSIFPQMRDKPIRAHYEGQSWSSDPVALQRWQTGQTGFPLIDAGMRELWNTGWMAQNVRMAAAILLCEHLNIHWVEGRPNSGGSQWFVWLCHCSFMIVSLVAHAPVGEKWFHHTLVDADQAINPMMWQNAGKSGLDQWNFTMHAASAGKTQDPKGTAETGQ